MSDFWCGFEKRADFHTALATGLGRATNAVRNAANTTRAVVGATAQSNKPQFVKSYQDAARRLKPMQVASIATMGTAGALYGADRLARQDVHQMSGQVPYPGQRA